MTKNKKNFITGMLSSGIIFVMGVLYLTVPSYFGLEKMTDINTNNLFISITLVYAVLNFAEYVIMGKNPNNEAVALSITTSITGITNIILGIFFSESLTLALSMGVFVFLTTGVKMFTIDYFHDREDAFYYVEMMLTAIFFIVGIVISFNLFNDSVLQTIVLGCFFIIVSILDAVSVSFKGMLKSKRFLKAIKIK